MNDAVAIAIVTHNSAAEIGPCLRALGPWTKVDDGAGLAAEVVVVDNASADATCRIVETEAPFAQLIRNKCNRGFAAAVNQAVRTTTSPLVLLLNPDAVLKHGLECLVRAFGDAQVAVAGGKLVDSSERWQEGFNVRSFPTPASLAFEALLCNRVWPRNPVNRRYRMLDFDHERAQDVDQPAGAFLMLRRTAWEAVGGLDESFQPLWFEDVDFCLRVRKAGHRIRYVPSAVARHTGAHSIRSTSVHFRQRAWYRSFLRFSNKHFSSGTYRGLQAAIVAGLCLRWCACWGKAEGPSLRHAYGSALKMVMGSQGAGGEPTRVVQATIAES